MPAGTITLTNNSVVVAGAGTVFDKELKAGDMIVSVVGGVTYTLPVKSVDSATKATLIKAYDGPTQAGAAWSAVPRETLNAITAQLAAETAKALRGMNYDKQNWQQVFSGTGNITVTLPDGSTYTGPAWNSFTTALNKKADQKTVDDLSVKVDKKADADSVVKPGDYGLGLSSGAKIFSTNSQDTLLVNIGATTGLIAMRNNAAIPAPWDIADNSPALFWRTGDTFALFCAGWDSGNIKILTGNLTGGWRQSVTLWNSRNTTVDGNGFIKRASPIVRLANNPNEMTADYLDGFMCAGSVAVNDEATGVHAERISTGVYRITGSLGLAREGWTIEVPQDVNGNRLCFVSTETDDDGTITVTVSQRRFDTDSAMIVAGVPMDIPAGRWIDLRLEMPDKKEASFMATNGGGGGKEKKGLPKAQAAQHWLILRR